MEGLTLLDTPPNDVLVRMGGTGLHAPPMEGCFMYGGLVVVGDLKEHQEFASMIEP